MSTYFPMDLATTTVPYISFRVVEYTSPYEITEASVKNNYSNKQWDERVDPKPIDSIYLPLPVDLNDGNSPNWIATDGRGAKILDLPLLLGSHGRK